jgi:hypothetical protein
MSETRPVIRRDLEFFPVQKDGQAIILIRDPLGLVKEGQAVQPHLYEFMPLIFWKVRPKPTIKPF